MLFRHKFLYSVDIAIFSCEVCFKRIITIVRFKFQNETIAGGYFTTKYLVDTIAL